MTNRRNTVLRSLHDLGLAAWFGGNLMGAIGVNTAAAKAKDPTERTRLSSIGWAVWSPAQAAFIGAHLAGSIGILVTDRGRVAAQPGARANTVAKTVLTAAALGTTAASGLLGGKIGKESPTPSATATEPSSETPSDVTKAQKALKPLQWATPALTAAIIVLTAQQGEFQRTSSPIRGRLGQGLTAVSGAASKSGAVRTAARKGALKKIG
jgi:hypothetical protein